VLVEVKNEMNYATSPNVMIELWSRDRPSGLATTAATVCIHYFTDDRIILYRTPKMKWFAFSWYYRDQLPDEIGDSTGCHSCSLKEVKKLPDGILVMPCNDGKKCICIAANQFEANYDQGEHWFEITTLEKLPASKVFDCW
jgi:hypothetical protein